MGKLFNHILGAVLWQINQSLHCRLYKYPLMYESILICKYTFQMSASPSFQEHWLTDGYFQNWLATVAGTASKAYCWLHHKHLSTEKTSLKRHRLSRRSVALEQKQKATSTEPKCVAQGADRFTNDVAYDIILLIVYLVKHNLPFR